MSLGGPETRSSFVHAQLRDDVLRGLLAPGQRLRLVELADRFSVSQSVVREALTRLAEQGLAVTVPQQGYRVTPLSLKDLDELTEARTQVETLVVGQAIERGDISWESSVVAAHHQMSNTAKMRPDGDLNSAWFAAHEQFHQCTLRGCGNGRLYEVAMSLRDAAALYRWWSRPLGHDYHRDVDQEHRQLLDAVLARDRQAAADVLAHHIQRTSDALRSAAGDGAGAGAGDQPSVAAGAVAAVRAPSG
jgi:DNA-binding GntR family transcriptional regulator